MSENFNPESLDATLATIITKLDGHGKKLDEFINDTRIYRKELDARFGAVDGRVGALEGNQKKLIAGAIAAATAAGGGGGWLARLFGGH